MSAIDPVQQRLWHRCTRQRIYISHIVFFVSEQVDLESNPNTEHTVLQRDSNYWGL